MDLDQLKLLLETLSSLGAAGKEVFIWWLVVNKLIPSLLLFVFGCFVIYAVIKVVLMIKDCCEDTQFLEEIIGYVLGGNHYSYITKDQRARLRKFVLDSLKK